ncbi:Malonyl CoA-acyl carrier protein transacylase [Usitatibacter rugosus]|uniref:Malonyl CoA-acyl carrier protein transacylase n=1 Tax=Usitatibacter rugosus TaxID=2732067 RepID=A0A6M4GY22_9PROT|nr:acyltransferase domain-containing protein [Usitatibacter rugosus]QJR11925.1 Malonyl CoA-acyl carrier protein transacylase [Usitatibacter rugosus]
MAGYLLLCPGQGSQHPAMLDFALATEAGRRALEEASQAASLDIATRVRAGDDLFEPVFAQVAVVSATLATWKAIETEVPAPGAVAGYSVGEVSSWSCAGTWTMAEAISLVLERARLMAAASPAGSGMTAVTGAGRTTIDEALAGRAAHVAIEVADDHWILGGLRADLEAAGVMLAAAGAVLHPLPVNVPSHTPLLATAAEQLRAALAQRPGRDPEVPVLRGVDGRSLSRRAEATDALADAVRQAIRWRSVLDETVERGLETALELGPGSALARMMAQRPSVTARSVADFRSVEGVARWLEARDE